jgi:haloacetate dehalogenase
MDNVPTRILVENSSPAWPIGWFVAFLGVPDLPEALIAGREETWLTHFYRSWSYNPDMLSPEEIDVYVRAYQQPGAVRGSAMDYRAVAEDVKQDVEDSAELITCPVLILWGEDFEVNSRFFNLLDVWRGMAKDVHGVGIPQCGHLCQEENRTLSMKHLMNVSSKIGPADHNALPSTQRSRSLLMKLIAYQKGDRPDHGQSPRQQGAAIRQPRGLLG